MVHIWPSFISCLMTSDALTDILCASSATVMVSGTWTSLTIASVGAWKFVSRSSLCRHDGRHGRRRHASRRGRRSPALPRPFMPPPGAPRFLLVRPGRGHVGRLDRFLVARLGRALLVARPAWLRPASCRPACAGCRFGRLRLRPAQARFRRLDDAARRAIMALIWATSSATALRARSVAAARSAASLAASSALRLASSAAAFLASSAAARLASAAASAAPAALAAALALGGGGGFALRALFGVALGLLFGRLGLGCLLGIRAWPGVPAFHAVPLPGARSVRPGGALLRRGAPASAASITGAAGAAGAWP